MDIRYTECIMLRIVVPIYRIVILRYTLRVENFFFLEIFTREFILPGCDMVILVTRIIDFYNYINVSREICSTRGIEYKMKISSMDVETSRIRWLNLTPNQISLHLL